MSGRPDPPAREASQPAMPQVQTSRIGPGGEKSRGPWALIIGAALLVLVAIVKPWAQGSARPVAGGPNPTETAALATATPAPTPPSADEVAAALCDYSPDWRVFAEQTWKGQTIKSWLRVVPVESSHVSGAADPRIPIVPLMGEAFPAIGYCAPAAGPDRPPAGLTVQIFDGQGVQLPVLRIQPAQPSSLAILLAYPAPTNDVSATRPWLAGRYVFVLTGPPGTLWQRWFAVQVVSVADTGPLSTP
ncbi:MAG: hypothetical protein ACHQ15_05360 [Candidatus Limnocylindrales bacterium]